MTYDAVLLLCGGGVAANGDVDAAVKDRLQDFLKHEGTWETIPVILAGGYAYKAEERPAVSEARAYLHYLESQGWHHTPVFLEENSPNTVGNILHAKIEILEPQDYHKLLMLPGPNHTIERVTYIARKILGPNYSWDIRQFNPNTDPANLDRERRSLDFTRRFGDKIKDGDHVAVLKKLQETHPSYGTNTTYSLEDLRRELT